MRPEKVHPTLSEITLKSDIVLNELIIVALELLLTLRLTERDA
jgi:hypothetical protein